MISHDDIAGIRIEFMRDEYARRLPPVTEAKEAI
jgi:hypothetical protein